MAQRVTTLLNDLCPLEGVWVRNVWRDRRAAALLVVVVALRRRNLVCPHCGWETSARYDRRDVDSCWRHLDVDRFMVEVRCRLRRLSCPFHGVVTEDVPFARPVAESGFTYRFEHLVCWKAREQSKTAVQWELRIAWRTVGAIVERVVADQLDESRFDNLFLLTVDEVSWRRHHKYLTLVTDAETNTVIWGAPGKDAATLDGFFDRVGEDTETILAVAMDMSPAFAKSVAEHTDAEICTDPFHVVKVVGDALDEVRRRVWNELRALDEDKARVFKGMRWCLLKNPGDLTDVQAADLRKIRRRGGEVWRAYTLKEALREVFDDDLSADEAIRLLHRWCDRASRARIPEMLAASRTIRRHTVGIEAALRWGLNNGRHEATNNKVRLVIRRAYGFHSPEAALALVMLCCGPVSVNLPWEWADDPDRLALTA